jgi:S-adenosylmethionine decarboxylase
MYSVGTEWLVDASGCCERALRDAGLLRALLNRIVIELNLSTVGEMMLHKFPEPGGVTALVLLSESHLTCHTYPEYGVATFNLYCCRTRPAWPWAERLAETLSAKRVTVRMLERALHDEENASEDEVKALSNSSLTLDHSAPLVLMKKV